MTNYIQADRDAAHGHAIDAADSLRALQATGVWEALPLEVRRSLSMAAVTLEAIATTMEEQGVV